MKLTHATSLFALLPLACAGATEDPTNSTPGAAVEKVSHARAALMIATNTESALLGLTNAGAFLTESASVASTINELGGSGTTCTSNDVACAVGEPCPVPVETCETDEVTPEELEDARLELEDEVRDLVGELKATYFNDGNIETSEDKAITYLLGPDDLCADEASALLPGEPGAATPSYDAECVDSVTRAAVRLRVTSPSEGNVDVTVLLTEERYEPMVFELHQDRLAVTADLDQLGQSLMELGEDLGGLMAMSGRLQLELKKNAERDYSANLNVLDELRLSVDNDGNRIDVSLGANSPTTEFRINGNSKTISADYDYGPLAVRGPLSAFAGLFGEEGDSGDGAVALSSDAAEPALNPMPVEPEPPKVYTGTIEMLLSGLSGHFAFAGDTDVFAFTNLGLGDETSTLKHDGNTVLAVDVNAEHGRRFDVSVTDSSTGLEFTFEPTFDASVLLQFSHLKDQFEIPEVLMNDTLRIFFDGPSPTMRARDNGLEVVSGTLHLSSSASPEYDLDVTSGMCLLGADSELVTGDDDVAPLAAPDPGQDPAVITPEPATPEAVEEEATSHPFEGLEVGVCE